MSSTTADPRSPSPLRRGLRAAVLGAALLAAPLSAHAQGSDKAGAESLFQEGKALLAAGKTAEACPKFAESQRLDPSVGTLLNLARCHEQLGRTASAWATYKEAATLARAVGQTERETAAKDFARKLEPRLSRLRIEAKSPPAGLAIKRDGIAVGEASLGSAIAVDPGEHTVEATAPGYKTWSAKIVVGAEADTKSVTVPALEPDLAAGAGTGGAPVVATEPDAGAGGKSGMRTAAFVVGGAGVVALGVGAVFGGLAMSDAGELEERCPKGACSRDDQELMTSANTKATVSTIGFGVGAAALGTGVVLFLLSRSPSKESAQSAQIVPSFGPNGGGASIVGTF
ncbi:tetratricopeptide repeat protein [Polyangium aurulentum]|uniref:tetratricopeptide repeat protein n=1 Tax=Polyangium aurulentum TaxID=2567896 RepID=UPI0010AE9650|nr:tetratricopeptide repeat protein [Polyangium aurulentum]UQA58666.1 hypothetical protein E8A73_046775 [Polyangium aurulentum]